MYVLYVGICTQTTFTLKKISEKFVLHNSIGNTLTELSQKSILILFLVLFIFSIFMIIPIYIRL